MMRYLIVSRCPLLTASPSGVSPSLVTAPIVMRMSGISLESRPIKIRLAWPWYHIGVVRPRPCTIYCMPIVKIS